MINSQPDVEHFDLSCWKDKIHLFWSRAGRRWDGGGVCSWHAHSPALTGRSFIPCSFHLSVCQSRSLCENRTSGKRLTPFMTPMNRYFSQVNILLGICGPQRTSLSPGNGVTYHFGSAPFFLASVPPTEHPTLSLIFSLPPKSLGLPLNMRKAVLYFALTNTALLNFWIWLFKNCSRIPTT